MARFKAPTSNKPTEITTDKYIISVYKTNVRGQGQYRLCAWENKNGECGDLKHYVAFAWQNDGCYHGRYSMVRNSAHDAWEDAKDYLNMLVK